MSEPPAIPRAWQRMLSGRRLDLLHPDPADIAIEDLAHGLARVARWNGQTSGEHVFSVAEHSVLVETILGQIEPGVTAAQRLAALLHDGPEYVVGDLISPFKAVLGGDYKDVEHRLLDAIHRRFRLPRPVSLTADSIKSADRIAAFFEATQLAGFTLEEARDVFGHPPGIERIAVPALSPLGSDRAEGLFLARFETLQGLRAREAGL